MLSSLFQTAVDGAPAAAPPPSAPYVPPPPISLGVLGDWGVPPDYAAWGALGLAAVLVVVALLPSGPKSLAQLLEFASLDDLGRRRRFLAIAGFAAAFLSLAYIAQYLCGGPRADDASTYFLEGRALSHGELTWGITEPSQSFRARHLLYDPDTHHVAGIFPPGFPILLGFGFMVGAPMVIGPLLAAAIVLATYFLARELMAPEVESTGTGSSSLNKTEKVEMVGRVAVGVSLFSAALRYHTADTLPYAASGLAMALALACALRGKRTKSTWPFVWAGLAAGYAAATRPLAAVGIAVVVLALAAKSERRGVSLTALVVAMLPGVLLFLLGNAAATGNAFELPAAVYYATSDGPIGCARYGFGAGIGCLHEHGEYVKANLPDGFGVGEALVTTLRRLRAHAEDILNFEPLALLVIAPLFRRQKGNGAPLWAFAVIVLHVLIHVPLYFDDVSPGAGAVLFADLLPIEHALVAFAIVELWPAAAAARKALVVLALACAGFAVHAVHDHVALAKSGAGRPAFEPDALSPKPHELRKIESGTVYFDEDQGFELAFVPDVAPSHGVRAARFRDDDHDRMAFDGNNGHKYVLPAPKSSAGEASDAGPDVPFWTPPAPARVGGEETWRFEAEADWPPLAQHGGWAEPTSVPHACASRGHVFLLHGGDSESASVDLELTVPRAGRWRIVPRVYRFGGAAKGALVVYTDRTRTAELARWSFSDELPEGREPCLDLPPEDVSLTAVTHPWLELEGSGGDVALDRVQLTSLPEPP